MKYNYKAIKRITDNDLKMKATARYFFKKHNKKQGRELKSLQDDWHCIGDWDSWTEYRFFDVDGMTDEDIEFMVNSYRIDPNFPAWDCSGLAFTAWIDWHRNPSGLVSVVHKINLDV